MGVVYRAHDEHLDRDVALKVLPAGTLADEAARKRFRKEALALAKLDHPNIEGVHDFDTQNGTDFLVMEYIPGVTLSDRVSAGPLPEKEILKLGTQLAEGLAAAHEQNIVHRDLKPGNLRITPDGRLKILDFGLAKLVRPFSDAGMTASVTETHAVSGTLPYMAPEQLQGAPVDPRTDIYAVGTVLYEMATGRLPFQEKLSTNLADAILHKPAPPPGRLKPDISPRLEQIILKCLEKEPENRYQSAKEMLMDLRRLSAPISMPAEKPATQARPRWQLATAISAIVVVALLAIVLGLNVGGWRDRLLGRADRATIRSLAVLPLENLSRDPEQEYFADGMTEAVITELSKIRALKVISRTSVMQYRGTRKPLPQIAKELNVDGVVEGSVLREGDLVRITVQLIHAPSDAHLWAESYQRELRGILALQSEVARAIAKEIQINVSPQEQVRLTRARRVDPDAYEAYLKGRYHWNKRTEVGYRKSLDYFQLAIEKDPSYALAYAGMADAYNLLGRYSVAPKEGFPLAKTAAKKALEIDETLAEAHTSLAFAQQRYDWDWSGAEKEFKRAIELNPGYATGHHWYALYFSPLGRHEEAIAEIERARELDPLSLIINTNVAWVYWLARQYDRAIGQFRKTVEMDPSFGLAHERLGLAYEQKGMYEEATAAFRKAMALLGDNTEVVAALGHALGVAGRRDDAQKVLVELQRLSTRKYVSSYDVAVVYLGLGDKGQALTWLEKACQERAGGLLYAKVDPRLDPLRSDPRFQDLLRRMNFPQ